MKVLVRASWMVFAGVHTSFVSAVTLLQGLSECLVWVLHHGESWGGGKGLVQSMAGVLGTEVGGNRALGCRESLGEMEVLSRQWEQRSSGLNPGVLGLGRMRWEN